MGAELDSKDGHARKRDASKRKRAGATQRKKASKRKNYRKPLSQWRDEINERNDSDSEDDRGTANNLQTYWQNWAAETLAVLEESYTGFTVLWNQESENTTVQDKMATKSISPSAPSAVVCPSPQSKPVADLGNVCEQDCGCCGQQALAVMLDSKGGHARKRDMCRRKRNESIQRKKLVKRSNYRKASNQRDTVRKRGDSGVEQDKPLNNLHEYWENWAAETLAVLEESYTGFTVLWNQDSEAQSQSTATPLDNTSLSDAQSADGLPSIAVNAPESMLVESLSNGEQAGRCGPRRRAVTIDSKGSQARNRDTSRRKRNDSTQRKKSSKRQNYHKTISQWRDEINERDDSDSDSSGGLAVSQESRQRTLPPFLHPLSTSLSAPLPCREVLECESPSAHEFYRPFPSPSTSSVYSYYASYAPTEQLDVNLHEEQQLSEPQEQLHEASMSTHDLEEAYQEAYQESHDQVNPKFNETCVEEQADMDDNQFDEERDKLSSEDTFEHSCSEYFNQLPIEQFFEEHTPSDQCVSLQDPQEQVLQETEFSTLQLQSSDETKESAAFEQTELSQQLDIAQLESRLLELTTQDEVEAEQSPDVALQIDAEVPLVSALEEETSLVEPLPVQESERIAEMKVASPNRHHALVSAPPSAVLPAWTSAVLLKVGAWVSGLFGAAATKTSGGVMRVGDFTVQEVLHESDRCSVVVAKPSSVQEEARVACKLTAEAAHSSDDSFAVSTIGLEWKIYSQLQQGPCPEGAGCRHDLLLRAYSAMAGVECRRPDGSVYCTNLLVLEEAAASLDKLLIQGPFRETLALALFEDLLGAVDTLHQHQICHRDLKPCQVLFSKEGKLKLADLDVACFFNEFKSPQYLDAIPQGSEDEWMLDMLSDGTPGWQAPEVAAWAGWTWGQARAAYYGVATAADLWGCGLILLCLLLGTDGAGEAPPPESMANPRLSAKAHELLSGLLATDPFMRMDVSSARQFLAQYWGECSRPPASVLADEIVSRLQRHTGAKLSVEEVEEHEGWMVVAKAVRPDVDGLVTEDPDGSWALL